MHNDVQRLIQFVLDNAPTLPLEQRAAIYRGLAKCCGDATQERQLTEMAHCLTNAERFCDAVKFSIIQSNKLQP